MSATPARDPLDAAKENAAHAALELVEDAMILGLGSGSTAALFVRLLGARIAAEGLSVQGVATSSATAEIARAAGVPLVDIDAVERIDLAIDGADEVDAFFNLIKGGGGCLLREKIVASASRRFVVIADQSKQVDALGGFPLPVEIEPFGASHTIRRAEAALRQAGCPAARPTLRRAGKDGLAFRTDGGHLIVDFACGLIPNPADAARRLNALPGVVEHGLFLDMAHAVIIGGPEDAEMLERRA